MRFATVGVGEAGGGSVVTVVLLLGRAAISVKFNISAVVLRGSKAELGDDVVTGKVTVIVTVVGEEGVDGCKLIVSIVLDRGQLVRSIEDDGGGVLEVDAMGVLVLDHFAFVSVNIDVGKLDFATGKVGGDRIKILEEGLA